MLHVFWFYLGKWWQHWTSQWFGFFCILQIAGIDFWFWKIAENIILCGVMCTEPLTCDQSWSWLHLPLGAVDMAGMAFIVGFSIFEDEAVGTLKAIGTLFHTIWTILEMKAFHTMLWALWGVRGIKRCILSFWRHTVILNKLHMWSLFINISKVLSSHLARHCTDSYYFFFTFMKMITRSMSDFWLSLLYWIEKRQKFFLGSFAVSGKCHSWQLLEFPSNSDYFMTGGCGDKKNMSFNNMFSYHWWVWLSLEDFQSEMLRWQFLLANFEPKLPVCREDLL